MLQGLPPLLQLQQALPLLLLALLQLLLQLLLVLLLLMRLWVLLWLRARKRAAIFLIRVGSRQLGIRSVQTSP